MKKLIALLMAVVMVFGLAACGGGNTETTAPADPSATTPDSSADATAAAVTHSENKLILGNSTELTGDFTGGVVGNGATDMMVEDLVNDYGTLVPDRDGVYVNNPTVLKEWVRTDNEDGSATYTITINEGLKYNNGEEITAADYVFKSLLPCTPAATGLNFRTATQDQVVGAKAAYNGEVPNVTGIRLLDTYTFSLTIVPEYAQYYYADTYAACEPWNAKFWLGEGYGVADDGEGAYITKDGQPVVLKAADVEENFKAAMSATNGFVSAGPYQITKWDPATSQCTLDINPNYAGNFEGQKPSIQTLVVLRAETATWADMLKTGGMDMYTEMSEGTEINTLMDMIDDGMPFTALKFDRAGYGQLHFLCDVGPTQFVEVRHAVAQLLNREEFVNTMCQGWGTVVNAPYATSMKMYQDSKDYLADTLKPYTYDVDAANAELDAGGWTLNAEGGAWDGNGLRHKDVTDLDVNKDGCVEVGGKTLMPLRIQWYATEGNPVSDLLSIQLVESKAVKESGLEVVKTTGDWNGLLNAIYHTAPDGSAAAPVYGMLNKAMGWTSSIYDYSFQWSDDPAYVANGYNQNYLFDMGEGGLDDLSMRMVYDVKPGDYESYLKLWQEYVVRWNELLPEVPLYCNIYVTAVPTWLEGYEQNSFWNFADAIIYASIPSAQ